MKLKWSDGEEFDLEIGQVWKHSEEGDIKIVGLNFLGDVTYCFLDNPELTHTDRIAGTDGFVDFLESCMYKLQAS